MFNVSITATLINRYNQVSIFFLLQSNSLGTCAHTHSDAQFKLLILENSFCTVVCHTSIREGVNWLAWISFWFGTRCEQTYPCGGWAQLIGIQCKEAERIHSYWRPSVSTCFERFQSSYFYIWDVDLVRNRLTCMASTHQKMHAHVKMTSRIYEFCQFV